MSGGRGGGPGNVKELLKEQVDRLRRLQGAPASKKQLEEALRTMDSVVSAYSDALFAKAVSLVDLIADGMPTGKADELRTSLKAAVEAFGGQETEFRRRSEEALRALDKIDRKTGNESRALFACAGRAEMLLLSASLEASHGDAIGMLRNMEELAEMVGAGSNVRSSHRLKICLLGEGSVGKTSLIQRFVQGTFGEEYQQTIGTRISNKEMALPTPAGDGIARVNLAVWDIMGHERLGRLTQSYLMGAQGALCVFSISDPSSLENLATWVKSMDRAVGRIPMVVMANKSDLEHKEVSAEQISRFAELHGCEAVATSAKTGMNVELAFSIVVRKILAKSAPQAK